MVLKSSYVVRNRTHGNRTPRFRTRHSTTTSSFTVITSNCRITLRRRGLTWNVPVRSSRRRIPIPSPSSMASPSPSCPHSLYLFWVLACIYFAKKDTGFDYKRKGIKRKGAKEKLKKKVVVSWTLYYAECLNNNNIFWDLMFFGKNFAFRRTHLLMAYYLCTGFQKWGPVFYWRVIQGVIKW